MGPSHEVKADYVNVTWLDGAQDATQSAIDTKVRSWGAVPTRREGLYQLGDTGTIKFTPRGSICVAGVSGAALEALRELGHFDSLLRWYSEMGVTTVSQLQVCLDVVADGPTRVADVYGNAIAGGVQLTRKALRPSDVKRIIGPGLDGRETGTVYLGRRTSTVFVRVYDKRQERLDRGYPDPGPLVRYELVVGRKAGATLRDVSDPAPVFWHYLTGLLERPEGIPGWVPYSEGFKRSTRSERLPSDVLRSVLERSSDIPRLLVYADRLGPKGRVYLLRLIAAMLGVTYDNPRVV